MSTSGDTTPLEADFVALRKLRDDDTSGALTEFFGDGEDPREWKDGDGDKIITVKGGRVTELQLYKCSIVTLPAAIGGLDALTKLVLYKCMKLSTLPDAIGELSALTTLALEACSSLAELPAAIGELGALTRLSLYNCSSLAALPESIGELGALTELFLRGCSSLATLPAAIGELGALTTLDLSECSSLGKLPDTIAAREGLTVVLPDQLNGPLQEDFAALRKLRDDDASGALTEYFGDSEDPCEWKDGDGNKIVTVEDGRVTKLNLWECSSLAALPVAIGELKALTRLNLWKCSSLAELPAAIGELGALTLLGLNGCSSLVALPDAIGELQALDCLDLRGCSSLKALPDSIGKLGALTQLNVYGCSILTNPPEEMHGDLHKAVGFCCLNLLEGGDVSAADVKKIIVNHVITGGNLGRIDALASKDSAFADITKSARADLASLQKLRDDDASGSLKELFGDGEDPREWKDWDEGKVITEMKNGRVTALRLPETSHQREIAKAGRKVVPHRRPQYSRGSGVQLTVLPATIGELSALTRLSLSYCFSLAELPAAIGKLSALTTLDLEACSSLAALPAAIGELGALKKLTLWKCSRLAEVPAVIGRLGALQTLKFEKCYSLAALPATIGELGALRTLDLSGCSSLVALPESIGSLDALTTLDLEGCSRLAALPATIGELGALTTLKLVVCSSLGALPDSIGKLGALTKLDLEDCSSLVALPESMGDLGALTLLDLRACSKLTFPPQLLHGELKGESLERIKRLLTNTTQFLDGSLKAENADDDAKTDFLEGAIHHAPFADRLEEAVRRDPALADLTNAKGERAIDLACLACRQAMRRALFFLGRYEIAYGPPEHRSATSLVVRALDYEAADDYGQLFDEVDDGDGILDADELDRLAAKLGTNVEILKLGNDSLTKDAFVLKCQELFGKERKVVIKIFQVEEQWQNEKKARDDQKLDTRYVVQTIPSPTDDEFADALKSSTRFGDVGTRAIVMDAADRNLFQIYQSERPDLNKVRVLMRETMECVQHLHEKKLVHGDIKMLNVVRLALDNRLRLIDLDAAAKISVFGGDVSYVGSKFSSAILPPECFAKLDADQVKMFEAYFEGVDAELREKVAPKVDRRGASYVVKTFSLIEDGAPKRIDSLPYELEEASVAVDYWSLGALLFQLVAGEPLVSSNRDDNCVDGNAMAALASWNDATAKKYLTRAIKDAAAFDLATKLLVRDPGERAQFSITNTLAKHPFFNPESSDAEIKKQLDVMQTTLNAVKADTSAILRLSEENREELQLTRRVLLKAVFEATEVTTPTTFVVLTEKLPPAVTPEQQNWIDANVVFKDDGSGVEIKGKAPRWFLDIEARFKDGMDWAKQLASFNPKDALTPKNFSSAIKETFKKLLPATTLYFYLVDELTGEPIKGKGYPIEITQPAEQVSKLLPVMQVGMHAMSAYQGVAGVARMFGYPLPLVPEKWRKAAQGTVELLKQESSVAAFGAIHEKVKDKDEANQTVRGASLRELEAFFAEKDSSKGYAGLRRIGDPSDGTAIWTRVAEDDVDAKLAERAAQRRGEENVRVKDLQRSMQSPDEQTAVASRAQGAEPLPRAPKDTDGAAGTATPAVSQEQNADVKEALLNAQELLGKSNGTCNNSCHCAIA